jgi:hypothetical protein
MLFQVALGALHLDVLVGRKLRADPIIRSGTDCDVVAVSSFKSSFQILAHWTIHSYPSSPPDSRVSVHGGPFTALPAQHLPLGVEPVLFVLAGFTTTAFIKLIGTLSNPVL